MTEPTAPVPLSVFILLPALVIVPLLGGRYDANITQQTAQGSSGGDTNIVHAATTDLRPATINGYLRDYDSQYSDWGGSIVDIADRYGLDPYLIVAIFVRESSAGKACFANNCFGFGKYRYGDVLDGFVAVAEALSGVGGNGHYYAGKTLEEKIKTYNSEIPTYYSEILNIINDINQYGEEVQ